MIYVLPLCRCGHGWLIHTADDGVEGLCLAKECGCPFYVPEEVRPPSAARIRPGGPAVGGSTGGGPRSAR